MKTSKSIFTGLVIALAIGLTFGVGSVQAAAWTPDQITTEVWLDAADASTITESGGAISQWDDKSGNNNHAVQGTVSSQPTTGSTLIGGLNAISFDSDYMGLSTGLSNVRAIFFVTDGITGSTADPTWAPIVGAAASGSSYTIFKCDNQYNISWDISIDGAAGAGDSGVAGISGNTPVSSSPVPADIGKNIELVPASSIAERHANPYQWYVGWNAPITVDNVGSFQASGGLRTYIGAMGEVLLLTDVPSLEDRQKIEGYLAWKWDLQGNLPTDHPYKSEAPQSIPEPASLGLFSLVGGMLWFVRRKIRGIAS